MRRRQGARDNLPRPFAIAARAHSRAPAIFRNLPQHEGGEVVRADAAHPVCFAEIVSEIDNAAIRYRPQLDPYRQELGGPFMQSLTPCARSPAHGVNDSLRERPVLVPGRGHDDGRLRRRDVDRETRRLSSAGSGDSKRIAF